MRENAVLLAALLLAGFSIEAQTGYVKGDFNSDGKPDLVWQNRWAGQAVVWLLDATVPPVQDQTPAYLGELVLPAVSSSDWVIVGADDFNADGKSDILWRHAATQQLVVWFLDGATYLDEATIHPIIGPSWRLAGTGDFNGDDAPDLVWHNSTSRRTVIWLMDGTTYVSEGPELPALTGRWALRGVGDFNRDGHDDLLWSYSEIWLVAWLMNGASYAAEQAMVGCATAEEQVAIADFNVDLNADTACNVFVSGMMHRAHIDLLDGSDSLGRHYLPPVNSGLWEVVAPK